MTNASFAEKEAERICSKHGYKIEHTAKLFVWDPPSGTVTKYATPIKEYSNAPMDGKVTLKYCPGEEHERETILLHELGHILSGHLEKYKLFKMSAIKKLDREMEAWKQAAKLAIKFNTVLHLPIVSFSLQSYKLKLHRKEGKK